MPLSLDPSLIDAMTDELLRADPFDGPFYCRYRRDDYDLHYVAARHSNEAGSPTFTLIRQLFERRRFDAVVLEAFPAALGESSPGLLRSFKAGVEGSFYRCGEWGYTAILAAERGIPFVGGEPGDGEVFQALKERGHCAEDYLGLIFLSYTPQLNRDGTLRDRKIEGAFDELIPGERERAGIPDGPRFGYGEFLAWHQAKLGRPYDPTATLYDAVAPFRDGDFVQRLAALTNDVRNLRQLQEIVRQLDERRRVLVVFGSGHWSCQRRALTAMFGAPVERAQRLAA